MPTIGNLRFESFQAAGNVPLLGTKRKSKWLKASGQGRAIEKTRGRAEGQPHRAAPRSCLGEGEKAGVPRVLREALSLPHHHGNSRDARDGSSSVQRHAGWEQRQGGMSVSVVTYLTFLTLLPLRIPRINRENQSNHETKLKSKMHFGEIPF